MIRHNEPWSVCCLAVQSFSLTGAWDHRPGVLAPLNPLLWVGSTPAVLAQAAHTYTACQQMHQHVTVRFGCLEQDGLTL